MPARIPIMLLLCVLTAAAAAPGLLPRTAQAQQAERCFAETGFCVAGRLLEYWQQNDGLTVFGLPITPQRTETIDGWTGEVQWFERNRLELHPENAPPYDVLVGRIGVERLQQQGRDWQAFPVEPADDQECIVFDQTAHRVCPPMLTLWQRHGIDLDGQPGMTPAESTALFGLPISSVQPDIVEGREYQVQWFERARFELHPQNEAPFRVLPGRLGSELLHTQSADDPVLAALVAGNTAFAFDAYGVLHQQEGNLFFSPYSMSAALAMAYAGARGTTAEQMAATLHLPAPPAAVHPAFAMLNQRLTNPAATADDPAFRLSVANALWGQQDYPFRPAFLDLLAQYYGAGLRQVDFAAQPEQARATVNDWVSDQTEGRIQNIIPPGTIDTLTRLVLANAISFKADWRHPFPADNTRDDTFFLRDGSPVTVPMMFQTETFGYAQDDDYQAVALPYTGAAEMVLLLPTPGTYAAFEANLDAERVQNMVTRLEQRKVALTMPVFRFETMLDLTDLLASLGMSAAFTPGEADFSGMDGTRELFLSAAFHKAFVAVDEQGTEAAAASAVVGGVTSVEDPEEPVRVTLDRPFIFFIREQTTGTVLFVGRVDNPQS